MFSVSRDRKPGVERVLVLNLPVLLLVAALVTSGQLLQLFSFPALTRTELVWILLSIFSYSALLTGLAALAGSIAGGNRADLAAAVVWAILLGASSIYLIDHFSYSWLSAHLNETVPLLIQNLTSFQSMRSKLIALMLAFSGFACLLGVAVAANWLGTKRTHFCKKPVTVRLVAASIGGAALLLGVDRAAAPHLLSLTVYEAKNEAIWQPKVMTPEHPSKRAAIFDVVAPRFRQLPDESSFGETLAGLSPADVQRPLNIFLFVVDSLRDDVITADIAPNLLRLKQTSLPVQRGIAGANVTHTSWFSLVHGVNPLYWSVVAHQEHSQGATPLRLLQRCGYRINALSCSSLEYFGFERAMIGNINPLDARIIDQRTLHDPSTDHGEGDVDDKLMTRLGSELDTMRPDSRMFYLIMLDSTHHDYDWSDRYLPKFAPFAESVSIFKTSPHEIEPLRNRYRNAVNFVDMLIGEFLAKLRARGLSEHSIVIVTGDHGEEFLERGHLVHSSELNRFQTRVPILIHVPGATELKPAPPAHIPIASHIDIFPTVFDALGLGEVTAKLLHGRSLLKAARSLPVGVCAMSSTYSPSELLLDAGDLKLNIEFEGIRKLGRTLYAKRLLASKVLDANDREITPGREGAPTVEEVRKVFTPTLTEILAEGP